MNLRISLSRRDFLKRSAAVAALLATPARGLVRPRRAAAGELPRITEDDPAAVQFGYYHDASKVDLTKFPQRGEASPAGQVCSNCSLFQPEASGDWGGCTVLPGKAVKATGWCTLWMEKIG